MRACEGCRRRKIKCDAATTNTWPCAACTRLKLTCVPPTVSYEKDDSVSPGAHTFELQRSSTYPTISVGTIGEYQQPHQQQQQHYGPGALQQQQALPVSYADVSQYQDSTFITSQQPQDVLHYEGLPASTAGHDLGGMSAVFPLPQNVPPPPMSERSWTSESGMSTLTDVLGDLQINAVATGVYSVLSAWRMVIFPFYCGS